MKFFLYTLFSFYSIYSFSAFPTNTVGGVGGQAVYDSVAQRFKIKSLELNHYMNANSLMPGDLILEIDKVPIHKMGYGDVLRLVQGTVGTPMSFKIQRYNAIEKSFEIKRIRVTADMNPTWWAVPDYHYLDFKDAIPYSIAQLKINGKNSIDSTKIPGTKNQVFCNYNIKGAYESTYINNGKGHYYYNCSFIKTEERTKAEGMYNYLVMQLRNYNLKNAQLIKIENIQSENKSYTIKAKEVSDISISNLNINVKLKKEFDKTENKELWKVEMDIKI